uniref:Uncharacterized protein n=1 Tax=Triticum urartu TaxID=4572 RepID=A0A8R7UFU4_TRIUA
MEEIIPVGREHVSPQTPLTEVISTSETTSGVDELCAGDFYNLRGVDDDTKASKKRQLRMREERIQNRRLKKQRKRREAQETVERALKLREELRQNRLDFEASVKGREDEFYYTPRWRRAVPVGGQFTLFPPTVILVFLLLNTVYTSCSSLCNNFVAIPTYCR